MMSFGFTNVFSKTKRHYRTRTSEHISVSSVSNLEINISVYENEIFSLPAEFHFNDWRKVSLPIANLLRKSNFKFWWNHACGNSWMILLIRWKVSKYGVFSGPYFQAFGLTMERYPVYLCIQCKWGKIQTRKNSVFRHFSHSVWLDENGGKYFLTHQWDWVRFFCFYFYLIYLE